MTYLFFSPQRAGPSPLVLSDLAPPPAITARPSPAPVDDRVEGWARSARRRRGLVVVVLVAVGAIYSVGLPRYPGRLDDEGTYVAQGWAVQHWHVLAHYTYWYDHPPLGWLFLALWAWATGPLTHTQAAVTTGRQAMVAVHLASCALLYTLMRRLDIRAGLAAAGVCLFSFSPLALSYHRQVYLDNIATVWLLAAFVLALSPRSRLAAHAASAACFAAGVLTKETTLLLLPAFLVLLWYRSDPRTRKFSFALVFMLLAVVAGAYPLYAFLKGELLPGAGHVSLVDGMRFQLGRPGSGFIFRPGSQAYQRAAEWLRSDPWLLVGGLLATPAGLVHGKYRGLAIGNLTLLVLLLRPGYLPYPYVIALITLAPVLIVGAVNELWEWCVSPIGEHVRRRRGRPGVKSVAAATLCLVVSAAVARSWVAHDAWAVTANADAPLASAEAWVVANLGRDQNLMIADSLWVDLVRAGWAPARVVWFFKIDHDAAVQRQFPRGWRDFQYIISNPEVRASAGPETPQVWNALSHSVVVQSFGSGGNAVEIRKISGG